MAIYAYFECYKCKNPYFGGRKNCAEAMNEPKDAGGFNAAELICSNCCEVPIENCPKHGNDFVEFKCKYCCSIAQWFCWGNTHFCEPCHKRQCNGDYVSKYTKDKLPKCEGPGKCPIGGNHNGNGDEKTLGCAICRNYKESGRNF